MFLLATMMFPGVMNLIPLYFIVNSFGWVNRPIAAIVPGAAGVFNIFLVRQFLLGLPRELDEAARIDGCNDFQVFWHMILPLIRPVLTVVALFAFTGSWNDFLWPSIVFNDVNRLPLTPGLQLLQGTFQARIGLLLAGALIAIIPTLLLYLFTQKYFLQSLSLSSGVKG
jgi:multiple sugar transport system permease protein